MNQRPHQEERPVDLVEERNMNCISFSIAMDDMLYTVIWRTHDWRFHVTFCIK